LAARFTGCFLLSSPGRRPTIAQRFIAGKRTTTFPQAPAGKYCSAQRSRSCQAPTGRPSIARGRKPLVAANARHPSPNGAKESSPGAFLSPRWGLYPFVQGLTPLAINGRPVGARHCFQRAAIGTTDGGTGKGTIRENEKRRQPDVEPTLITHDGSVGASMTREIYWVAANKPTGGSDDDGSDREVA
jgi:hypothetical protein